MSEFQFLPLSLTFLTLITPFKRISSGIPHLTKVLPQITLFYFCECSGLWAPITRSTWRATSSVFSLATFLQTEPIRQLLPTGPGRWQAHADACPHRFTGRLSMIHHDPIQSRHAYLAGVCCATHGSLEERVNPGLCPWITGASSNQSSQNH